MDHAHLVAAGAEGALPALRDFLHRKGKILRSAAVVVQAQGKGQAVARLYGHGGILRAQLDVGVRGFGIDRFCRGAGYQQQQGHRQGGQTGECANASVIHFNHS